MRANPLAGLVYPGAVLGVALFTGLVAYHGVGEIFSTLAAAGFGLAVVAVFHLAPLLLHAAGWRCLLSDGRPGFAAIVFARWISESINALLPVAQVGGNIVRARMIMHHGVTGPRSGASVVVDMTLVVLSQIAFTLLGLGILGAYLGGAGSALPALAGVSIMGLMLLGFYLVQRRGMFSIGARVLDGICRRFGHATLSSDSKSLDSAISRLYGERRALVTATLWHLASWVVGAGEVWLALKFLGHPVDIMTALLIESLGQAIRTAAFSVPGALGVQEGGYLLIGAIIGVGPDTAIALSLAKRTRELILGIPGLVVWQVRMTSRRSKATPLGHGGTDG